MPNAWMEALKEYNKGSNSWCIVKKGTSEYDKVKNIMEKQKKPIKMKSKGIIDEDRMKTDVKYAKKMYMPDQKPPKVVKMKSKGII